MKLGGVLKAGEIVEFDKAPGWYAWMKHQIRGPLESPMGLGSGAWIIGVFFGPTTFRALQNGEVVQLVEAIGRKSEISKRGFIPVHEDDLVFPTFLSYESKGRKEVIYLCQGNQRLRQVAASEVVHDVRFRFGLDIGGVARAVNMGYFDRVVSEAKRHPLGLHGTPAEDRG